ncbi:reverse transcriptase family protein [Pseudomonas mosselii]|uniref:reverse transcriptase family protein n=1 Tax=Pseudomonas mosselii TaxID=78327 RepID=UPI0021A93CA9|nr:reverse transcriptase family protein [Pseudomonas mosselii]UWS65494.1 reverse transcriptase family protein [Pseudomonas mosselii]
MEAPLYPHRPIYSLKALSLALAEPEALLVAIAKRSSNLYRYVPQKKRDGSPRDTFDAYEPLKAIQRKIVDRILIKVKYPAYLHGGIRDAVQPRSIYSNARSHAGSKSIILQDIKNFFPSITTEHVEEIFSGLFGFSNEVSSLLAALTTRAGQVPQGASTSSYLANLVFWDVEPALVKQLSSEGLAYSRFADDITVSSKSEIPSDAKSRVISAVTWMLSQKGCQQKRSKLHIRRRGQSLLDVSEPGAVTVTGLTVDRASPGIPKDERRLIRAMVKRIELQAAAEPGSLSIDLEREVRRLMGKVGRLIACGHPDGLRFKARLRALLVRPPVLERYAAASPDSEIGAVARGDADQNSSADRSAVVPPWDIDAPSGHGV